MAKAKWSVMVLMGANNLENVEADLTAFAEADLKEMQEVDLDPNQSDLRIVVQLDQKPEAGPPQRFLVTRAGRENVELTPPGKGSSGDPDVLEAFVTWAKERYEAEHYLFVIWGHAWRFAFARDGKDALDFTKLSDVLQRVNGDDKLDIVAFDSCDLGWFEAAYQLRAVAKYLVATQFTDPLPGWPYTEILSRLKNQPSMGAEDLGRAIVSQFVRHYDKPRQRYSLRSVELEKDESASVTMTTLDLSRAHDVGSRIQQLAIALALAVDGDSLELSRVRDAFERSRVPIKEPAADLTTLCWHLVNYSGNPQVRVAAAGLSDLLLRPRNPLIVAHAKSDISVAMLNGVSIFAPNINPQFPSEALRPLYEQLDLSQDTLWDELVYALTESEV